MVSRARVVWRVARDPQLRRLQVSFLGFAFAEHATWLAIIVYAYERGGVAESGLVALVQLLPAMVVAPFAAYAGDRFRAERVLTFGYAAQSVAMTATAVGMWAGLPLLAYAAATVAASTITFARPVLSSVLPAITRTPGDLVAANVVTGFVEYVGMMLGPLIGGVILAAWSPAAVFAACGLATANSAIAAARVRLGDDEGHAVGGGSDMRARDVLGAVWQGLRAVRSHGALRSLIVLMSLGGLVRGVYDVLLVTYAAARLGGGGGQAGLLGTGAGIGAVAGAVLAAGLIGRARIAPYLLASALLFASAFWALSAVHLVVIAVLLFGMFGLAESLLRVTAAVGVQRLSPDEFLARIFGVGEGLQMAAMALGSFLVSILVRWLGLGTALVALGSALLLSMAWSTSAFRRRGGDVPPPADAVIDRLLADPVFEHLGVPALSRLALAAVDVRLSAGVVVITQGQPGDRYYLVVDGSVDVTIDGRFTRTMSAGASFGEIALVRAVPRTATVTTSTEVHLLAIERDDFLQVVTGHPRSTAVAADVVRSFVDDGPTSLTDGPSSLGG